MKEVPATIILKDIKSSLPHKGASGERLENGNSQVAKLNLERHFRID